MILDKVKIPVLNFCYEKEIDIPGENIFDKKQLNFF